MSSLLSVRLRSRAFATLQKPTFKSLSFPFSPTPRDGISTQGSAQPSGGLLRSVDAVPSSILGDVEGLIGGTGQVSQ